jgi:UDP-3-O-[3-hydroxymyristoyl] glucosamine N-acyltransferase
LDFVKIAKNCNIADNDILEIGSKSYVEWGHSWIREQIKIGNNVSIAQSVNIMTDSGPNASEEMQFFPLIRGQ